MCCLTLPTFTFFYLLLPFITYDFTHYLLLACLFFLPITYCYVPLFNYYLLLPSVTYGFTSYFLLTCNLLVTYYYLIITYCYLPLLNYYLPLSSVFSVNYRYLLLLFFKLIVTFRYLRFYPLLIYHLTFLSVTYYLIIA